MIFVFLGLAAMLADMIEHIVGWISDHHPTLGTIIGVPLLGAAIGLVLGG